MWDGLPPVQGVETVRFNNAINPNIITALENDFEQAKRLTRSFAQRFKGNTVYQSAKNVWDFLKQNIVYERDPSDKQMIRLPNRFVSDGTGDCKSYSLFAASILANLGIPVAFRYASYRPYSKTPTHVYVVLPKHNIIVDGVYNKFNEEKKYSSQITHPMQVVTLSDNVSFEDVSVNGMKSAFKGGKLISKIQPGSLKHMLLVNYKLRKRGMKPRFILPKQKLIAALRDKHAPGNKLYQLAQQELKRQHGVEINGIGGKKRKSKFLKILNKAVNPLEHAKLLYKGIKATALHGPRLAFAFLVSINYRGLATKLSMGVDGGLSNRIYKLWKRLGGARKTLDQAIAKGKNKKIHFAGKKKKAQLRRQGVPVRGFDVACTRSELAYDRSSQAVGPAAGSTATALTAAGSVLAAFAAILKALPLKKNGDAAENPSEEDAATSSDVMLDEVSNAGGNPTFTPGTAATDPDPGAGEGAGVPDEEDLQQETRQAASNPRSSFSVNPMLIAAAVAAFLLFKK